MHEKISVIGASILDVTGVPNVELIKNDSNPGHVFITPGGVARNIAENLALLKMDVNLISAIGNDSWGKILLDLCEKSNIKTDNSIFTDYESTALYLSINNLQKNLEVAVVNTDITNRITNDYIDEKFNFINSSSVIIAETNLSKETLEFITQKFNDIPIFLDLVSIIKAKKVKDFIGKFHTIKPNLAEAEMLTGIKMNSTKDLLLMADYFCDKGVKQAFITMGKNGCFYTNEFERGFIEGIKIDTVNSSGAGDAYISGLVYSYLNKKTLQESAIFATAMSLAAVLDKNSVNPNICVDLIEKIIKKYELCSKNISISSPK
jgi:pseudouridine kinase